MVSRYGWVVDIDHLAERPDDSRVGTIGPRGIPAVYQKHFETAARPLAVRHWRTKDSDGELYYEGRYIGPDNERMFGPLEDFAMPDAGASEIEYLNPDTGAWEAL